MAIPFEMFGAPGALIPSLTNLVAAYANKTRSQREREREDKHRDFAQRLQLRGIELQEQRHEAETEAARLNRETRETEFRTQMELRRAEDDRRQAEHETKMQMHDRALKMQEYEALRMQEQEGLELDKEGKPTGRRTVDPLRRMQLGVELGIESPEALERYMQQRGATENLLSTALTTDFGQKFMMGGEGADTLTTDIMQRVQPYMVDDPEAFAKAVMDLQAVRGREARAARYREGWQNKPSAEDFADDLATNLISILSPRPGVVMPLVGAVDVPLAERLAASRKATETTGVSDEAAAEYWARQAASRKPSGPTPEEVAAYWARQAGR